MTAIERVKKVAADIGYGLDAVWQPLKWLVIDFWPVAWYLTVVLLLVCD